MKGIQKQKGDNLDKSINALNTREIKNFYIGEVVGPDIDDETANYPDFAGRIKVKIPNIDRKKTFNELDFAYPLIPKPFHICPKVGEAVFVFLIKDSNKRTGRLYVGPLISNPANFKKDNFKLGSATSAYNGIANIGPKEYIAEKTGRHFEFDDVVVVSRSQRGKMILSDSADKNPKNSSILLHLGHENSILKSIDNKRSKDTKINAGYFEIKQNYNVGLNKIFSETTVLSDKIKLLSYRGSEAIDSANFKGSANIQGMFETNNTTLLTSENLSEIEGKTYSLVRGEVLIDIIKDLYNYINEHIHDYPTNSPSNGGNGNIIEPLSQKINNLENTLINKNIKLN